MLRVTHLIRICLFNDTFVFIGLYSRLTTVEILLGSAKDLADILCLDFGLVGHKRVSRLERQKWLFGSDGKSRLLREGLLFCDALVYIVRLLPLGLHFLDKIIVCVMQEI